MCRFPTTIFSSWPCSPASKKSSPRFAKFATSEVYMSVEVTMPQLSDTMTEGTVVKWHKKEGDKVRAGEEIADVETDKAVMPMEAFESGTLALIKVKEGEKVAVGGVLAVIATGSEKVDEV